MPSIPVYAITISKFFGIEIERERLVGQLLLDEGDPVPRRDKFSLNPNSLQEGDILKHEEIRRNYVIISISEDKIIAEEFRLKIGVIVPDRHFS